MKKDYLTKLLRDECKYWSKKKVLITAPTGMGKSTFIIHELLPYLKERGKKLLILCNRRLLRDQYWQNLVQVYDCYDDLEKSVELMTYQQLAEKMNKGSCIEGLFCNVDTIVCDEAHYFYADSDFNGSGTFTLLQAIVYAGMKKTIIFMSATMEKVSPLIRQTIRNGYNKLSWYGEYWKSYDGCGEIIDKDFSHCADYERFHCVCMPDMDSLLGAIAESPKKSVLFIDNKEKGAEAKAALIKTGKVEAGNIAVLNAENIDDGENNVVIRNLTMANQLACKILITTSVLDNGVSIHDSEVGNLVIMTESKVSFLQMLGRIRAENVEYCNLYFVKRDDEIFKKRMLSYKSELEKFNDLNMFELNRNMDYYLHVVWDEDDAEKAVFYKKALVLADSGFQIYSLPETKARLVHKGTGLFVNEFAKCKIGDMYIAESKFYSLAVKNPLNVIYEQMKWIGKNADELEIRDSTYLKEKEKRMKEDLLKVKRVEKAALQEIKEKIVKEYRKDFFPDIYANNGTISNEKLDEVCKRFGLHFQTETDENRRKVYSIVEA